MLAVQIRGFGDPSVVELAVAPDPRPPRGDQLLVRVAASSINGTDLGLRRGEAKIATWGRMPFTLGFDMAGTVVAIGPRVTAFAPGDRVMALLGHAGGGQAERVLLRQGHAARVPDGCSLIDAAAIPLAGLTALQALHRQARLSSYGPGARVLVIGASGGIGSFAVQLAKRAGAHVTGVASGSTLAFVADLGADEVVDRHLQDVTALTGPYDVIVDSPARYEFDQLTHLLRAGGVMVTTRPSPTEALRSVRPRLAQSRRRWTAVMTSRRSVDLARLGDLVSRGQLRTNVHRTYPMSQAAAAHRAADGPTRGKIVIAVAPV